MSYTSIMFKTLVQTPPVQIYFDHFKEHTTGTGLDKMSIILVSAYMKIFP